MVVFRISRYIKGKVYLNSNKMIKGFKGFDKNLTCRGHQFEIGKTEFIIGDAKMCNNGFHFCTELTKVFDYYSIENGSRFCEVEAYNYESNNIRNGDKSVSKCIKVVRELSNKEIFLTANSPLLLKAREYQSKHPQLILCGSLALGLLGFYVKRKCSDIDFISPYYLGIKPENVDELPFELNDDEVSGKDFDNIIYDNGIKIEVSVDPTRRFKRVKIDDFEYKVSYFGDIMDKKLKYAIKNRKHADDAIVIFKQKYGI